MLKIDIHTHIIPEHLPRWADKFGEPGFIHLEHHASCKARMMIGDKFFREIESNCWDADMRVKECDEHGVHVQVLSTIPVLFNYWANPVHAYETSRFFNDHIAQTVALHPKRFIGIGTVPLQSIDLAIKEMERCVKELKFPGIEIGSHCNEWNLSDRVLFPFYEAAEQLGCSLFVHPWEMMGSEKMKKYWLPWLVGMPAETSLAICSMIFGGVFEKFPKLKVAFAHGGGSFPATIGRIEHGFNVRPDLTAIDNEKNPKSYLGKFYLDSLVHDKEMLSFIVNLMGANRVCLGSDYPFPLGEHSPGKLIAESGMDKETTEWLMHGSALEWLNLKKEMFVH